MGTEYEQWSNHLENTFLRPFSYTVIQLEAMDEVKDGKLCSSFSLPHLDDNTKGNFTWSSMVSMVLLYL